MPSTKLTQSTLEYLVPFTPLVFSINGGMGRDCLTLSGRRLLSNRNQSIDLLRKSMDGFLYDSGLRLERVNMIKVVHLRVGGNLSGNIIIAEI